MGSPSLGRIPRARRSPRRRRRRRSLTGRVVRRVARWGRRRRMTGRTIIRAAGRSGRGMAGRTVTRAATRGRRRSLAGPSRRGVSVRVVRRVGRPDPRRRDAGSYLHSPGCRLRGACGPRHRGTAPVRASDRSGRHGHPLALRRGGRSCSRGRPPRYGRGARRAGPAPCAGPGGQPRRPPRRHRRGTVAHRRRASRCRITTTRSCRASSRARPRSPAPSGTRPRAWSCSPASHSSPCSCCPACW